MSKGTIEGWRIFLAIMFPPLAVLDKGCGTAILVLFLTLLGWIPGVIMALFLLSVDTKLANQPRERRFVEIPGGGVTVMNDQRFVEVPVYTAEEKSKRKGAFIRLEDGAVAEIIEDDGRMPEKRKRV